MKAEEIVWYGSVNVPPFEWIKSDFSVTQLQEWEHCESLPAFKEPVQGGNFLKAFWLEFFFYSPKIIFYSCSRNCIPESWERNAINTTVQFRAAEEQTLLLPIGTKFYRLSKACLGVRWALEISLSLNWVLIAVLCICAFLFRFLLDFFHNLFCFLYGKCDDVNRRY